MKTQRMTRHAVGGLVLAFAILGLLLGGWAGTGLAQIPTVSDVYVDRGILAYDLRQYAEALQNLQEALSQEPENVNALYYLGLTQMALDRPGAAVEPLRRAQALAPGDEDVQFQLAVAYFTLQQYDLAEPTFRQLYNRDSKRHNLGYYLGFMEYRKQNYREALRLFRANVASDDSYAQLNRFYAGLCLSALGMAGAARAEIEEAIRSQPISALAGPAERFRDVLGKAAKTERKFNLDAKLGLMYDDNVAVIPDAGLDPSLVAAREAKHRSLGEMGYVRFEYQPLRTPDWDGVLGGSILGTLNNDVSHYNILSPGLFAGLSYKGALGGKPWVGNLLLQYDYTSLDDRNYSNRYTLAPSLTVAWDEMHQTQLQLRYQYKDYMHEKTQIDPSDARDGNNFMAGLVHYVRFQGDRHYLRVGYQFDFESTDGSNWDYNGHRLLAGFLYTLPWFDIKFRYDFDVHFRTYRHAHSYLPLTIPPTPPYSVFRRDYDINNMFVLSKELPYNVTVSLEYLWSRDDSNLDLFTYNRNVITLGVAWRY
jgi:tetratricopeptide (TPR) repeat protein